MFSTNFIRNRKIHFVQVEKDNIFSCVVSKEVLASRLWLCPGSGYLGGFMFRKAVVNLP
jgi:hypothetical protein